MCVNYVHYYPKSQLEVIVIYRIVLMKICTIETSFASPERPKAGDNKTGVNFVFNFNTPKTSLHDLCMA